MLEVMQRARIVLTNYHAFKPRQTMDVTAGGRKALAGHGSELQTAETEDRMVARVCGDLEGLRDVIVINDEAHHCYRVRPEAEAEERGRSDQAREARENNEAARLWIAGLETVARQIGVRAVYDLSATPFFLSGSGYPAGSLFPWVVSDFSLVDAIECGVVKLPRVPVSDNLPTGEAPLYRNLWPTVRDRMPTGTRGGQRLDPQDLPLEVKTALDALYGHYEKTFDLWERQKVGVPPVFIVVCANTVASELVYEYIAGYHRTDEHEQTTFFPARFDLFSNFGRDTGDPHAVPRTLLIDSIQIEKGDTIDDAFRKAAAEEIDRFRRDKIAREGAAAAEKITDAELLREAMNTVGRKGRLGEQIRCVVSVGMLTEGWDANTVTHILGLRAFGSRLLCEQVMGRALRRLSYDLHDTPDGPRYRVEYADIMGIDGLNLAPQDAVRATPATPRPMVRVEAVSPERDACEIRFPRVEGYRVELPDTGIAADWSKIEPYVLTPAKVGPCEVTMRGIVGAPETLTLQHLAQVRDNEIIVKLTGHLVFQKLRDGEDRPIATLIPKIKPIVRRFLDDFVDCRGGTVKRSSCMQLADRSPRSSSAPSTCTTPAPTRSRSAVLAPYAPVGSTLDVGFNTPPRTATGPIRYAATSTGSSGTAAGSATCRAARHPPPRRRVYQEPRARLRGALPFRRRASPLPPRLHPAAGRRAGRRGQPGARGQGLPRPRRDAEGRHHDHPVDPRREPPRPLRPLGVRRAARDPRLRPGARPRHRRCRRRDRMTVIGRLVDTDPRTAWLHEAHEFTPWLIENLDLVGTVIDRRLEPEGREIRVGPFSADILARDIDGNRVLVENQLATTDHSHLGQIMTYLAGLDAKIVVWIATAFREEHLSAINWLNENTVEPFAFFAVQLRVVRIGDSAPAPILDVMARPNQWEREIKSVARAAEAQSDLATTRRAFWTRYLERHPEDASLGVVVTGVGSNWLAPSKDVGLFVAIYRATDGVGVFVRGRRGVSPAEIQTRFAPLAARFTAETGPIRTPGDDRNHPGDGFRIDTTDPANWDAAIDWMHGRAHAFLAAVEKTFGDDQ